MRFLSSKRRQVNETRVFPVIATFFSMMVIITRDKRNDTSRDITRGVFSSCNFLQICPSPDNGGVMNTEWERHGREHDVPLTACYAGYVPPRGNNFHIVHRGELYVLRLSLEFITWEMISL